MYDSYNNTTPAILDTVKGWLGNNSDDTLELRAYDKDGKLSFGFKNYADVCLDRTTMTITIFVGDGVCYTFAVDYWLYDHHRYVVHTRDGHDICFVDWGKIHRNASRSRVEIKK